MTPKAFFFFALFLFLSPLAIAQSGYYRPYSRFIVPVEDSRILETLNRIEDKVTHIPNPYVDAYMYTEWSDWTVPLTLAEIKKLLAGERIRSNSYEMDVRWNTGLDTAYVLGCTRRYEQDKLEFDYVTRKYSAKGRIVSPFWRLVLNGYSKFLPGYELNLFRQFIVQSCAKKFQLKPITDTTFIGIRELPGYKLDVLPQMPSDIIFDHVHSCKYGTACAADPEMKRLYTKSEVEDIDVRIDTNFVIDQATGMKIPVPVKIQAHPVSLLIAESWSVIPPVSKKSLFYVDPMFCLQRRIKAIGLKYDTGKVIYMPYESIMKEVAKKAISKDLFIQVLNADLVTALDICFYN